MSTPNKIAPDFGEPWQLTTDFAFDITILGELAASFDKIEHANRAIACVNACAGMAAPAKELQAMREAIGKAAPLVQYLRGGHRHTQAESALAKLQPFLKNP